MTIFSVDFFMEVELGPDSEVLLLLLAASLIQVDRLIAVALVAIPLT